MRALLAAAGLALTAPNPWGRLEALRAPLEHSDPMTPRIGTAPRLVRHDLHTSVGLPGRRLVRAVRDLCADRFDVDALEPRTPLTAWTVDGRIVAFRIERSDVEGGALFALIDEVEDFDADRSGASSIHFVDVDGETLDGAMSTRPVRYLAVTSHTGLREHPLSRRISFHAGTDYAAPIGTPVEVVADGVVTTKTRNWSAGKYVIVKHDNGWESRYLHFDQHADDVVEGGRVVKGQVIGYVGKTGRVTGAHLHFEVRDVQRVPLDMAVARLPGALQLTSRGAAWRNQVRRALFSAVPSHGVDDDVRSGDRVDPFFAWAQEAPGIAARTTVDRGPRPHLPPLPPVQRQPSLARLVPPPPGRKLQNQAKRRKRDNRGLFDDVTGALLEDALVRRALELGNEF